MEMDLATYARLTDIKRYIASEYEPEPASAGQGADIEPRRGSAFQALRAIFGLERRGVHMSVEPARDREGQVDARAIPADR
jgi:hypothetical protein